MREAHPTERAVGIEHYVTDSPGVGGRLRATDEAFRVTEREAFETQPVDADTGDYPHLVVRVTLHGWDTNDFARRLANELGMSRERVAWAGTKDKRAVSTQLFSLDGVDPADLPSVDGADVEVVGRAGRSLQFGDLLGNDFTVVVGDPADPDRVGDVTADLRAFAGGDEAARDEGDRDDETTTRVGVPNWFGQQRFGSRRPVTHRVGRCVVRGDWEGAVLAYLGNPTTAEPDDTRDARAYVDETRDWQGALDRFPDRLRYERTLLHSLVETGGETADHFREALSTFPENLQRLFVHATQSFAFNRMLSERLQRGLPFHRPVEGDVVCFADSDATEDFPLPDPDRTQRVTEKRVRSVTRHCERRRAFVTAPLVGTDTDLADGEQGEIERAVLDDLDLSPVDFDLPDPYGSTGTRRAVLVTTDLAVERDPLTFSFSLPKGSYATGLLREFLQVDPVDLG